MLVVVATLLATLVRVARAQANPFTSPSLHDTLSDQCFCKLEGAIDDCRCEVGTVDHFNNAKVYPRLASLLQRDYFRYFQYQPHKKCPFWEASTGKCSSSLCQVKSCPTTDLPPGILASVQEERVEVQVEEEEEEQGCEEERLTSVDSTMSAGELASLSTWRRHHESLAAFCELEEAACPDCVYVDLTKNPERFTGYSGPASRRVWASIYEENCFTPASLASPPQAFSSAFGPAQLGEMCLEKRAFYRVVSGLHTSITIHLAANYPAEGRGPAPAFLGPGKADWGPNLELFTQRFDPELTGGQGPYWLKNLYFVYLLELRALAKASSYLSSLPYFTGREEEDQETARVVGEILQLVSSFPEHFDETSMFTGGRQADELKVEFQQHFRNITRVMDCVGCDKCKLWGKLQVTGLGTALKILFSGDFDRGRGRGEGRGEEGALPRLRPDLALTRNEVVSLFNAFGKISTSIVQLERFREMLRKKT